MKPIWKELKRNVIDRDLCTRCGSCAAVCPKEAIGWREPLGKCLPVWRHDQVPEQVCLDCEGPCLAGCSGNDVHFPTLQQFVFERQPQDLLLGNCRSLYVGHSTDESVRKAGASGGVLTEIACYLLENNAVDGVVTLGPDPNIPYRSRPMIARNRSDLMAGAQSKYTIHPVNTILREIGRQNPEERFAFIGIPCQIHSIRKLQAEGHPAALKLTYMLGSYCGNILHFDSVLNFLRKHGDHDLEDVARVEYRAGEWPGKMRVTMQNGQVFEMEKFYANYLIPFYIMKRCLFCIDLANEFADISCGDAWAPIYEERGKGYSLIMGRTERGQAVLDDMLQNERLVVDPVDEKFAVEAHSHMLDFKTRGAFLRMRMRRMFGRGSPRYGMELSGRVPVKRHIFEAFIDTTFEICRQGASRFIVAKTPHQWIGPAFMSARNRWKSLTSKTKHSGIGSLTFVTEPARRVSGHMPEPSVGIPHLDPNTSPARSAVTASEYARREVKK